MELVNTEEGEDAQQTVINSRFYFIAHLYMFTPTNEGNKLTDMKQTNTHTHTYNMEGIFIWIRFGFRTHQIYFQTKQCAEWETRLKRDKCHLNYLYRCVDNTIYAYIYIFICECVVFKVHTHRSCARWH